ncbi:hypothetical protein COLO4_13258 [Corchorus olitorius]|uniref:Uncharacterized protein n=1 Tax=Corchorus olitorius TaxID=93759 RepID=A0A1R3JXD7_9ROSI|nr:hypothetical protein COLO4_13258 [Corchorus olitorius]
MSNDPVSGGTPIFLLEFWGCLDGEIGLRSGIHFH